MPRGVSRGDDMSDDAVEHVSVLGATDAVIAEAKACGQLTALDDAAVSVLRHIARQIDERQGLTPDGKLDNVSVPMYLNYLKTLGLTPEARADLAKKLGDAGSGKKANPAEKFRVFDKKSG